MIQMKTLIHDIIDNSVDRLESITSPDERDVEQIVEEETNKALAKRLDTTDPSLRDLSPTEQTYGLMILFSEFGVDHRFILEEIGECHLKTNIHRMFSDAFYTVNRVVATRANLPYIENKDQSSIEKIDYDTSKTLKERIEEMPDPVSIFYTIHEDIRDAGNNTGDTIEVDHNLIYQILPRTKDDNTWDPDQQVFFITETQDHFEVGHFESGVRPSHMQSWEEVIESLHLQNHIEGTVKTELEKDTTVTITDK